MNSLASFLGYFLGALAFTFLITRVAIKATGQTRRGAIGAFVIGLAISWILSIASGVVFSIGGPDWEMLAIYTLALLIWLSRDYKQAANYILEKSPSDATHPSVALFASQDIAQQTSVVLSKEVIAFRFLLLTWVVSFLMLCFAGFSYVKAENDVNRAKQVAQGLIACESPAYSSIPECNQTTNGASEICNQLVSARCSRDFYGSLTNQLFEDKDIWMNRAEISLYVSLAVVFLSSFLFYGIRWATTGRLKPLWLFKR